MDKVRLISYLFLSLVQILPIFLTPIVEISQIVLLLEFAILFFPARARRARSRFVRRIARANDATVRRGRGGGGA